MYRLNNIKQNILIVFFATLLAGSGVAQAKAVAVKTSEPIITENSATIKWIQYGYTTKLIEYGTSKKYGSELLVKEEGIITLDNLQPNTLYHYRIVAEDKNGRKVVSRDKTFTTLEQSTLTPEPILEPTPEPTPEPIPEPTPVCKSGPAMQQGQVKDSISGIGIANVTVMVDGCTAQTDAEGFYQLNDIAVSDKAMVTFKHHGYYTNSEIITIKEYSDGTTLSPNYLEFALDSYDTQNNADSQNEKWWRYVGTRSSF